MNDAGYAVVVVLSCWAISLALVPWIGWTAARWLAWVAMFVVSIFTVRWLNRRSRQKRN